MLKETQASLDNHILKDGTGGNVNRAALVSNNDDGTLESHATGNVDSAGDGEVIKLNDPRNGRNVLLEVRDLLEMRSELDEGGVTEASRVLLELAVLDSIEVRLDEQKVGACLHRKETATRHVDTVSIAEVANSRTNSSLKLQDRDIGITLLDSLAVGDDLKLEFVVLDDALDGLEVEPNVVRIEVSELLDGFKFVHMLLGDLGNLKETDGTLVIDDGTTLDVGLGFVGQLHNVLGIGLNHVLEDPQVDHGTKVVDIGKENDLDTPLQELIEDTRIVERLEDVTVAGGVPVGDGGVKVLWDGEE